MSGVNLGVLNAARALDFSRNCKVTKFADNALKGHWVEGQTRELTLSDDDPEIFASYLYLLYGRPLPLKSVQQGRDTLELKDRYQQFHLECDHLCRLHVFVEKFQDVQAKDSTIGILINRIERDHMIYMPRVGNNQAIGRLITRLELART
ncbi:hypothetical protein BU23DRAFT_565290 [Bimuria novae-zelandiae CBS 107.79]|uniref:BTB domain-containing protein n=1 Tax=Bimuria novae-zelandiae CBS 107.79 TaxID=1447943 RepID=A0A6A5VL17_9PLEO|nr:hypothetical protein BU23DRAFT_565290 [Bimuria novae-zelandiae CBS 107.79]